jgi:hypothetical protein
MVMVQLDFIGIHRPEHLTVTWVFSDYYAYLEAIYTLKPEAVNVGLELIMKTLTD